MRRARTLEGESDRRRGLRVLSGVFVWIVAVLAIQAGYLDTVTIASGVSSYTHVNGGGGTDDTVLNDGAVAIHSDSPECHDFYATECQSTGNGAFGMVNQRVQALLEPIEATLPFYTQCMADYDAYEGEEAEPVLLEPTPLSAVCDPMQATEEAPFSLEACVVHVLRTQVHGFPLHMETQTAYDRAQQVLHVSWDGPLHYWLTTLSEEPTEQQLGAALYPEHYPAIEGVPYSANTVTELVSQYGSWGNVRSTLPAVWQRILEAAYPALAELPHAVLVYLNRVTARDLERLWVALEAAADEAVPLMHALHYTIEWKLMRPRPFLVDEHREEEKPDHGEPGTLAWYRRMLRPQGLPWLEEEATPEDWGTQAEQQQNAEDDIFGAPDPREERHKYCMAVAHKVHRPLLNARFYAARLAEHAGATLDPAADVTRLLQDVKRSIASLLHENTWLHTETRDAAIRKLEHVQIYVLGDADWGPDGAEPESADTRTQAALIDAMHVRNLEFGRAQLRTSHYEWRRSLYTQYARTVPYETVNAWYQPAHNTITVPLGILDQPIYTGQHGHDLATVGMILAHEMGHALDVGGRFFDHEGRYVRGAEGTGWWHTEDATHFAQRMACLAEDFGHPCGREDYGQHTMGEDMADQIGVRATYRLIVEEAWGAETSDGLTDSERSRKFFRDYARLWCRRSTSFGECMQVQYDVHALAKHRVNKSLRQLTTFAATYGCGSSGAMVNEGQCLVY